MGAVDGRAPGWRLSTAAFSHDPPLAFAALSSRTRIATKSATSGILSRPKSASTRHRKSSSF
eukprot:8751570-Lingulodinium_polyedra.AAC.1